MDKVTCKIEETKMFMREESGRGAALESPPLVILGHYRLLYEIYTPSQTVLEGFLQRLVSSCDRSLVRWRDVSGKTLKKWQYFECRVCPRFFKVSPVGIIFHSIQKRKTEKKIFWIAEGLFFFLKNKEMIREIMDIIINK